MRNFAFCITAAVLLLGAHEAHAQGAKATVNPPVYAVLSLVGDQLGVVVAQIQNDLNFAPYRREILPIENRLFDDSVISAAGNAIRKVVPNAELSALRTNSPVLFDKQRTLFEENGSVISVPAVIKRALQQQKATHLVLVTKHRDDINLRFGKNRGSGDKLEGLGFYVDDTPTSAEARNFISPFVYLRVALIDTSTWRVVSSQIITASSTIASARGGDATGQWLAMSPTEKAQSVDRLMRAEIGRVIPLLLRAG